MNDGTSISFQDEIILWITLVSVKPFRPLILGHLGFGRTRNTAVSRTRNSENFGIWTILQKEMEMANDILNNCFDGALEYQRPVIGWRCVK